MQEYEHKNNDSAEVHFDPASRHNRRTRGQRRICGDRRKANIEVTNCRRRNTSDRRSQRDRRPTFNDQPEILGTVPIKQRSLYFSAPSEGIGRFVNITV